MAIEIIMPKLGLTMTEAMLSEWMVLPGKPVKKDQVIAIIETDKVSSEVPSPGDGLLVHAVAVGTTVVVSGLIGYLAVDETELKQFQLKLPTEITCEKVLQVSKQPDNSPGPEKTISDGIDRLISSPKAKALAKDNKLDLSRIPGTGPAGRIVKTDILNALEAGKQPSVVDKEINGKRQVAFSFDITPIFGEPLRPVETIPIRGIRRVIFQNMRRSLGEMAQLTIHTEASAKGMTDLRQAINDRQLKESPRVSFNAIIVKAVAQALTQHPHLNASAVEDVIKIWKQVHIGVAMDLGKGLIVPKVRNADKRSIRDISMVIADLSERAANSRLLPEELSEGTFTITNLGAWDTDCFTPIINHPESAILGVGRIVEKPWARNGTIVIEPRLALSLTFDHRIIDGAPAAAFLKTCKDMLEDPGLML
jgi:pyruvate/2-oxoglutarate dehydrogenase complex dihydrolipoamide acyltransferase (E2) component